LNNQVYLFLLISLAFMKNAMKTLLLLLFALGLILFVTNGTFMKHIHSYTYIDCESSDNDVSNQLNDSHSFNFDDESFISEFQLKPTEFTKSILLLTFSNENYQNNFSNSIWQPPKRS
jgi:hypothetical protein